MPIKTHLFDMTGQVALVTGGTSGIGLAIAEAFVQHGARCVVGSRTQEKVDKAAAELNALPQHESDEPVAVGVSLDVQDDDSVQAAVKQAMDTFGRLDVVVNSAGVMHKIDTFELEPADLNRLYDIHVTGALRASQAAGHVFREQHGGTIINIASISSFVDLTGVTAYAAAKNALLGLTRSLCNEWSKFGIRTNAIAPGFIPTDINRKMIEGTDRGRRIIEHTPMQRFGTADEIAGAAVYLASPAGKFVNGHCIVVDGGYLASGIGDSVAPWTAE
jgi:NAD(P)-dependent dehydrogenase (short-subunit alcohol dehydrogenase family)